jgi:hypothetical protein
LDHAKRICHHEYVPTRGDILRTRARTTGAVEFTFRDRGSMFTIVDIGGQRSQRMKWSRYLSSVTRSQSYDSDLHTTPTLKNLTKQRIA